MGVSERYRKDYRRITIGGRTRISRFPHVALAIAGCFYVDSVGAPEMVERKKDFEVTVRLKTYED